MKKVRPDLVVALVLAIGLGLTQAAPVVYNNLFIPHSADESAFPATASNTRGAIMFGTDAGVHYWSPGDGGTWQTFGSAVGCAGAGVAGSICPSGNTAGNPLTLDGGVHFTNVSGTVSIGTITGGKICEGTGDIGCWIYEATNGSNQSSVGITATTFLRSIGAATASLPSCVAGMAGAEMWDTTVPCMKVCDGANWNCKGVGLADGGFIVSEPFTSTTPLSTYDDGGTVNMQIVARWTLDSVYVNAVTVASTTYGGGTLPAIAFTVQAIRYRVRTIGSGGTTAANFAITDGTNTCNCATTACNEATGSRRATCAGGGGAGCAFPASAALVYSVSSIGDCTVGPDWTGNVAIEGIWQ